MGLLFVLLVIAGMLFAIAAPVALGWSFLVLIAKKIRRLHLGRALRPVLRSALARFQAAQLETRFLSGFRGRARIEGCGVMISQSPDRNGGLWFAATAPKALPHRFAIFSGDTKQPVSLSPSQARARRTPSAAQGRAARPAAPISSAAVPTLDGQFDQRFVVHGRMLDVLSRLDAGLRTRLRALGRWGSISISGDLIELTTPEPIFAAETITKLTEQLASVARDLASDDTAPPARLLANALGEPIEAARYQLLDTLLREFPNTREADEALKLAWDAPERSIRYLAAIRRGELGLAFLEEVVEADQERLTLRSMALRHLARHAPRERVLPLVRRALSPYGSAFARVAAEVAGRLQDRESVEPLLALSRHNYLSAETRTAVAQALGAIGDPRAEECLLALLDHPESEVRFAAATALGRAGTPTALGPLSRIASRVFGARELARAAQSSIARIHTRFGRGGAGRLSIVEEKGLQGAVSFQPEEGAVSLFENEG